MDAQQLKSNPTLSANNVVASSSNGFDPMNKAYIVVLCLSDAPGLLADCLLVFKAFHISLKKIESRRSHNAESRFDFFVEFETSMDETRKQEFLAALLSKSVSVAIVSEGPAACHQGMSGYNSVGCMCFTLLS